MIEESTTTIRVATETTVSASQRRGSSSDAFVVGRVSLIEHGSNLVWRGSIRETRPATRAACQQERPCPSGQ